VNAKLLYCHPPPGIDENEFNEDTRRIALKRAEGKKRAPTTHVGKNADTYISSISSTQPQNGSFGTPVQGTGQKSQRVDQEFFTSQSTLSAKAFTHNGQEFSRNKLYPHQNSVADDGTPLSGRRARIAAVLVNAGGEIAPGKKHHKKMKRVKHRSGKGYDD
jgi:large subunit GTPase 1